MLTKADQSWSTADSIDLYQVDRWGQGYFSVGENGNLRVHPKADPEHSADLMELLRRVAGRGVRLPLLVRFNDILAHRLESIHNAFAVAAAENEYRGDYCCVYPIKVNQQRQVVEEIVESGKRFGFGLEAGSKPELLAVIAVADNETPIICNGFKDSQFIEMAMLAQKMGRNVIPVVEKASEFDLILEHALAHDVRPQFGMRVKLAASGAGRWKSSGGYKSKFGLRISEILEALDRLKQLGMEDCFQLLHFHLGSQITNIRPIKSALIEATGIYAELVNRGAGLNKLNVGGGLGVDYSGAQSDSESSMNYTLQEYANDVIHHVGAVCNRLGVDHPTIISESGRAVVAYHSLLLFEVLGTSGVDKDTTNIDLTQSQLKTDKEALPMCLSEMKYTLENIAPENILERFHDAQQSFELAVNGFVAGSISLDQRSVAEQLYWRICRRIRDVSTELEHVPDELTKLDALLAETYFCNFSLFQSLPDSWAIDQIFPVMPVHRLNERPTRAAVIGDITCDSDGRIDRFVAENESTSTLPLHQPGDEPYYLGAFLVGAYQEILGDLHNLFGDTHAVHVSFQNSDSGDENGFTLEKIVRGDSVRQVLGYVQFDSEKLIERMESSLESAVSGRKMTDEEAGKLLDFYEQSLRGYTYLQND